MFANADRCVVLLDDSEPLNDVSLKSSWTYQWRISISTAAVFASVAAALWSRPLAGLAGVSTFWLVTAAWILLVLGVLARLWATTCLGGRKARELIDVGPYSLCRNPLYVGTLLIAVAQIGFYQSLWIVPGIVVPALIYVLGVVPAEENLLRRRLGAAYDDYCRRTPRWIPNPARFKSSRLMESTASRAFRHELLRSVAWLLLPLLAATLRMLVGWRN